jgi:superfamily II DNA or RNA helicase
MTEKVKANFLNWSEIKLSCSAAILHELSDVFSYFIPSAKFNPKYKAKKWDGKIRLVDKRRGTIPLGLIYRLKNYCSYSNYEFETDIDLNENEFDQQDAIEFISNLDLPFEIREYQLDSFIHTIRKQRSIIISPTASGKSLIIYLMIRFLHEMGRKVLMIVPTVNLVTQMKSDFDEYAKTIDRLPVQEVYAGRSKELQAPIMLSTWQSLQNIDKYWFTQFDAVIVDETHLATGNTLQKILNNCSNADFRVGLTGTLSGEKVHEMLLISALGEPKRMISTSELIEQNYLSDLEIKCLILQHEDAPAKLTYQEEISYLISHTKRNQFLVNLATNLNGNTLVLFNYVESHGKILYEMLEEQVTEQNLFFMAGETKAEIRENIRQHVRSKDSNNIIVASSGVFSTGVNIPSLRNVIFASPTKSKIRVLQSIGRILRLHESKDSAIVYDIADKLYPKRKNYVYSHFESRYQYYLEEDFHIKYHELKLKSS